MAAIDDYNNKYIKDYPVLSVILEMVMPVEKRNNMDIFIKRIPEG
jgi:hypothetical protein